MGLHRTVAELLDSISAAELGEWEAYYRVDPWGEQRADQRAAHAMALTAACHGASREARDFMLHPDVEPVTAQTPEEIRARLSALTG